MSFPNWTNLGEVIAFAEKLARQSPSNNLVVVRSVVPNHYNITFAERIKNREVMWKQSEKGVH